MTTYRRGDLERMLADRCRLISSEQATAVINELFGEVGHRELISDHGLLHEAVSKDVVVKIAGFGKFERRERRARSYQADVRRKGAEGKKVRKPKHHVAYFTASPQFTRYVRDEAAGAQRRREERSDRMNEHRTP